MNEATICWHSNVGSYRERTRNCRWPHKADAHVMYGRCRSGRRWFWTTSLWGRSIEAAQWLHGWEDAEELALEAARLAVAKLADGRRVCVDFRAGWTSSHLKDINRAKRAAKPPSDSADSKPVGYLFGCFGYCDDMTNEWVNHFYRFQIVKKTAKRVYYLAEPRERIDEFSGEPLDEFRTTFNLDWTKTGFVDRQKLEAEGCVENRGRHWSDYDSRLYASLQILRGSIRRDDDEIEDIAKLKQAMAAAHPDRGGSSAAFIEARARYVDARRRARHA
jgi:hypothetical protein